MTESGSSDQLRVCFISLSAYTFFNTREEIPPGGAERQLYLLSQELKSDFDVRFVVGDYGQPAVERRDEITLYRAYTPASSASFRHRIRQLGKLFFAMRRANADVYVYRDDRTRAIITYLFATILGRKWVYNLAIDAQASAVGTALPRPIQRTFNRVIKNADGVIAQSAVQRTLLRESFGIDAYIVPNGYPPVDGEQADLEREYFLYVGRIDREQKRPHLFLELARELPDESFVLVGPMAHDQTYYREIESTADALPNVEFVGKVDPENIYQYYERAIGLINTSAQEGFPNTFLEAWRSETPVISLDVDPSRFNGGDSIGYAGGDFDELVAITRRFANEPSIRRSVGIERRCYFENHFSLSAAAGKYAEALRSSAGRAPPKGDSE